MNDSGQPVEGQSPESNLKSISSKTSINVKLPSAQGEDGRRRGTMSGRRKTQMTPGITLEPTLGGNELIQGQRFPSARRDVEPVMASSRASLLAAKVQHQPSQTEMEWAYLKRKFLISSVFTIFTTHNSSLNAFWTEELNQSTLRQNKLKSSKMYSFAAACLKLNFNVSTRAGSSVKIM